MEICSTFSAARALKMVAWTGIEPVTRGFSTQLALISLAFMRVSGHFRVTCDRACYRKNTEFRNTFSVFSLVKIYSMPIYTIVLKIDVAYTVIPNLRCA